MKAADDFCRKAINFDLNTDSLKKTFKSNNPFVYLKAYKEIGIFLKNNNFEHRQWSGYVSKQPLTPVQVTAIVKGLNKTFPWLKSCVRKFDVTNIGEQHDLMYIFENSEKTKLQEKTSVQQDKEKHLSSKSKSVISRASIKQNAKIISEKEKTAPKKEQNKNKDNVR